jgi:hypothetical protein
VGARDFSGEADIGTKSGSMVMMYLPAAAVSAGIDALGFRVWRLRVIDLFIGWWITKSRRRLGANVRKDRV